MNVLAVARALQAEAQQVNERRLLVLAGDRDRGYSHAETVLDDLAVDPEAATLVGPRDRLDCEHLTSSHASKLLGTTREVVLLDIHEGLRPNTLGRVVGAVDGGGLLVLISPPLDTWVDQRGEFEKTLAVPPFEVSDVSSRFRERFVETLRAHPGIAIVDVDDGSVERDGLTDPAPRLRGEQLAPPDDHLFPRAVYDICLTPDQVDTVHALETLREPGSAVVVEADRGRGKSAAAGLAAGALAAEGRDVLVTAPEYRSAEEMFVRARALLSETGSLIRTDSSKPKRIESTAGGCVRYEPPAAAESLPGDPDVVVVDEAAALPVRVLESFLAAPAVAFTTTVHGYEGAGRGFSVRFRDRLDESGLAVAEVSMAEPIRYAGGDPVEVWAFRALLLDARPAVDPLVADAPPEVAEYQQLTPDELLADEHRLREAFGLLVLAHYRTEPDDLARLLDAPNISVRALTYSGHVVSVALLAREGGLSDALCAEMYDGARIPGNMLPDVLASQLRDESAGRLVGQRVMRIATHPAVRSRGLGSQLLAEIRAEFDDVDWLGTGYGATPELLEFWAANGFSTIHLSTTRNDSSGEYSVLMMDPRSEAGRDLHDRHAAWFLERVRDQLSDPLRDTDPDVVRATLEATSVEYNPELSDREWLVVTDTAYGPGLYASAPAAFRTLAIKQLADPSDKSLLTPREERLLVLKVLQGYRWSTVMDRLGYHSHGEVMRALGRAYQPLVDAYGTGTALAQRNRYSE